MPSQKRLRIGIARDSFIDLPEWSSGWQPDEASYYAAVADAGYEAVQGGEPGPCHVAGLQLFGNGVVCTAANARTFADHWKSRGAVAATCIAGFGYESDEESDEIARAVLAASRETGMSLYLEIHRSSITQDSWRCLQLAERNPDLRFNLDFSHWYTGQQMSYGDFEHRLELLRPVLAKVRLLHGRIGNSCCMQVGLDSGEDPLSAPFRRAWTTVMKLFAQDSDGLEDLWFFPEVLGLPYQYARVFNGREESDRWQQALLIVEIAAECVQEAGLAVSFPVRALSRV